MVDILLNRQKVMNNVRSMMAVSKATTYVFRLAMLARMQLMIEA